MIWSFENTAATKTGSLGNSAIGVLNDLHLAPQKPVRAQTQEFALSQANQALLAFRKVAIKGAAVLFPPATQ